MSLIYKLSKIPLILKQAPVSHLLSIGLLIQWSGVGFRVSKGQDVPGQTGAGGPVVPLSRDKKVSLSRCPFVPGQKSFACPVVPLSRDNEGTSVPLSLTPGTMKRLLSLFPAGQENPIPLKTLLPIYMGNFLTVSSVLWMILIFNNAFFYYFQMTC